MSALLAPAPPAFVAPAAEPLDHARLLRKLACQRSAVVPVAALPKLWGLPADTANEVTIDLMTRRAIEAWDVGGTPHVIISSATARGFGLELVSPESDRRAELVKLDGSPTKGGPTRFQWVPIVKGRHERAAGLVVSDLGDDQAGEENAFSPDHQPDPRAVEPLAALIEREAAATLPRPIWLQWRAPGTLIVGDGLPWPDALRERVCPGCHGEKLPANAACLPCLDRPEWVTRQKRISEALDERRGLIPRAKGKGKAKDRKSKRKGKAPELAGGRGRSPRRKGRLSP